MVITSLAELVPVLQTAIGPVILISGVGLLLLTMTNRLGRVTDRIRIIDAQYPTTPAGDQGQKAAQLSILWRRARLLRLSLTLASLSALCAALLVVLLFLAALFQIDDAWLISATFVLCMATLIGSLLLFIHDLNQSLSALKLELEDIDLDAV